jgi:hypothetical protein
MAFTIPQGLHIVNAYGPCAADDIDTNADYVCLKNVHRAFILVKHAGANDTDLVIGVKEATAVAGTSAAAITTTFPIWTSAGTTSADAWTKETNAATYTIDPATKGSAIVIMQIDPSILSAGFDCIQVYTTGGHADNFVDAMYVLQMSFKDPSPVSAIVD